jgi:hypothetical protein
VLRVHRRAQGRGPGDRGALLALPASALFAVDARRSRARRSRAATAEERYLAGRHGAAFERYRDATPRFLPSRLRHALAESIAIQPRVLWKAFVDGSAFLLLYVLVVAARDAAGSGVLPTLFGLP